MVMLLRLSPILPFALLNYGLSVTPISAWTYTWASAIGIIPGVHQLSPIVALPQSADLSSSSISAYRVWMAWRVNVVAAAVCRDAAVCLRWQSGK